MDYPIRIDGARAGTLRESVSGLYTVFEAELPDTPPRLLRLWVHGEGESACLGLMEPKDDGLFLLRRFSALERKRLPARIVYASEQQEKKSLHNAETDNVKTLETEPKGLHNNAEPQPGGLDRCPWPAPVGEESGDLLWLRRGDGTLTAHDGISTLLALPARLRSAPRGAVLRRIEGMDYLVFRY